MFTTFFHLPCLSCLLFFYSYSVNVIQSFLTHTKYNSSFSLSSHLSLKLLATFFSVVLVLAEIELFFLIVPGMELCFGSVLVTVLIIKGWFIYCWAVLTESRPFLLLTPPHQGVGWGCTRSWEGTRLGQLTPADQRDIPYHILVSNKSWGKHKEGGTFRLMAFGFPSNC